MGHLKEFLDTGVFTTALVGHSSWQVRRSGVRFCHYLLQRCSYPLQPLVPLLIETLVIFSRDSYPIVQAESTNALLAFQQTCQEMTSSRTSSEGLCGLLRENVSALISSLSRRLSMANESEMLHSVSLIEGYLLVLGSAVTQITSSPFHLSRLIRALCEVV